ncbi:MAG: Crp/Fnr family transcriptional regulator [Alphaproteobacteria bacterium]|nr:Crp/Fnr family transcriptional regulator [Alphaproteobacteria bacterium]
MAKIKCQVDQCACSVCHVLQRSDWRVLAGDDLAILSSGVAMRHYRAGETIYWMGDANRGIHCVSSGLVGVRKIDAEGNSVLLRLGYPGDTLGYRSFLMGSEHKTSAETLEPTALCHVRPETVAQLLERNPSLGLQFLRRASDELEQAHHAIFQSVTLSNRQRFVHLLLVLARRHGRPRPDGSRTIRLPLSRGDLASMIGTRHETLSRIIGRLEADGVANFSGRLVHVPKLDALAEELEPGMAA